MTLDVTPPELAADIMEKGIMLAGGGALLHGMPECLAHETGMPVCISPQPLHAVALGSGKSLESFDSLKGFSSRHLRSRSKVIALWPCHEDIVALDLLSLFLSLLQSHLFP